MEDYESHLKLFHKERLLSLSDKDAPCLGCTSKRQYKAREHELILSCGSQGKSKCGDQIKIQLPTYVDFPAESQKIRNTLNGVGFTDDIHDLTRYDLTKLLKIAKFSRDFAEAKEAQDEESKTLTDELKEITKSYETLNRAKEYGEMIQELYTLRHKVSRNKTKLMKRLTTEDDNDKLHEYRVEYAKLWKLEKEEVLPLIQKLETPFEDYLILEDPKITTLNETYLKSEKKPKKPRKKKTKKDT
jgi:hypothetical protein